MAFLALQAYGAYLRIYCQRLAAEATEGRALAIDLVMPEMDGVEVLVWLSGTVGEEVAVEAMRFGATDYLLKDRIRLASAVERALNETQLRAERRQTQEALRNSEQRLRSIIEHTMDCIMVVTPGGVVAELNHAGLTMLEERNCPGNSAARFRTLLHDQGQREGHGAGARLQCPAGSGWRGSAGNPHA